MATHQIAQGIAGLGRHGDSMLVHMSPSEVKGLQSLAMAHGGSMTINPDTGLPEAFGLGGLFKAVLPIAAGALLGPGGAAVFDSALTAGLAVGAGAFALTGDPMQAISAGVGGYGGANLGANLASYGKVAAPTTVAGPAVTGAQLSSAAPGTTGVGAFTEGAGAAGSSGLASTGAFTGTVPYTGYTGAAGSAGAGQLGADMSFKPANLVNSTAATTAPTTPFTGGVQSGGISDIGTGIGKVADKGLSDYSNFLKSQGKSIWGDALTVGAPVAMAAMQPEPLKAPTSTGVKFNYQGPYTAQARNARMPTPEEQRALAAAGSPEFSYYSNSNPYPGYNTATTYAEGGNVDSDMSPPPVLSQDGYGLGRLNALARGGTMNFDAGGSIPTIGGPELSYEMSAAAGKNYATAPTDLAQIAEAASTPANNNTSAMPGIAGILGVQQQANNATMDPMGRMTGTGINQSNRNNAFGFNMGSFGGLHSMLRQVAAAPEAPKALTMQDYINAAKRTYRPEMTQQAIQTLGAPELEQFSNINPQAPQLKAAGGGIHALRTGGRTQPGGYLDGKGDGMSDSIPATIEGKQPARLADGEFVIPADVVSHLGNGSSKAGAKHLYKMMAKVRQARTGSTKQGKKINPNQYLTA